MAPPPMEEATQYTQIQHEAQNTIGLYYLATPSVSIEPDNPQLDNSEYSRLNTRGYRSPHQPDFAYNAKNNETYSTIAPTASQHNNNFPAVNTGKKGVALMNKVKNLVTLFSTTVGETYCHFFFFAELIHGALTKHVVPHISDK